MTGKHILLVDDERNMLDSLAFILEAASYRVTVAEDGKSALQQIADAEAARQPIDLLVTDVRMPGMDGIGLLKQLQQQKINIPTVVMTEYGTNELKKRLLRLGCHVCLNKPLNERELLQCIQKVLAEANNNAGSSGATA